MWVSEPVPASAVVAAAALAAFCARLRTTLSLVCRIWSDMAFGTWQVGVGGGGRGMLALRTS